MVESLNERFHAFDAFRRIGDAGVCPVLTKSEPTLVALLSPGKGERLQPHPPLSISPLPLVRSGHASPGSQIWNLRLNLSVA